ncbi:hypothetical protein EI42_06129 [Thermosporothrix hazakensis]|uniref:Uncharacterized protein n=2 Tax=Thermosporothrix hazakensis TaxID=644383 RepID=A0A326TRI6_THEHA|nr:hypothetical protein EI42_06129 [Thermosporothrix hazakensis]GCE48245.1 hypothetical protein KTH_31140 [Thermosporothrix hazakensis]
MVMRKAKAQHRIVTLDLCFRELVHYRVYVVPTEAIAWMVGAGPFTVKQAHKAVFDLALSGWS